MEQWSSIGSIDREFWDPATICVAKLAFVLVARLFIYVSSLFVAIHVLHYFVFFICRCF
jgi:hypothetical protein